MWDEGLGKLARTLVVVTSDHGMPSPHVKGRIHEAAFCLPLAMRWAPEPIHQPNRQSQLYIPRTPEPVAFMKTNPSSRLVLSLVLLSVTAPLLSPRAGDMNYPVNPVPINQVHLNDGFWKPRLDTNRTITVPVCFKKCEEERIPNFRRAAKLATGNFRGDPFDDSDLYKVAEGAAYCLGTDPDPALRKYLDDLVSLFGQVQQADGYLYTARIIHGDKAPGRASPVRWLNEMGGVTGDDSHELYCAGHLIEAAVAHYQTTTNRAFLNIATKLADLIQKNWGPGTDQLKISPGHQEIELALVKLGRATGEQKYLELAKFLLDCRGRYRRPAGVKSAFADAYYSNEVPLTNLTQAVGHAVRTGYMLSGMTDIAALFGDPGYARAVDTVWADTVGSKLYLHGGIGSGVGMSEGFGNAYELPNSGYCETCAAVANCLWNHRMFLLHGDVQYIDVLERTLYNGFLSGVALSGDHFFYQNPLVSNGGYARSEWFGCACCPVNVSRFLPSVPGLQYAVHADQLYVNLFAAGTAELSVAATRVKLAQATRYPWDGAIRLTVLPERSADFAVRVRIPGWARNQPVPTDLYHYSDQLQPEVSLSVNGQPQPIQIQKGYAVVNRRWQSGDVLTLNLAMPVRRVVAHAKVTDDAGRVALERGPLVFCFEGVDHQGKVMHLTVPDDAKLESQFGANLLGGVVTISGKGQATQRSAAGLVTTEVATLTAIPYYAWGNRGAGQMQVWMPRQPDTASPLPFPTAASQAQPRASHCNNLDTVNALNDGVEPKNSGDHALPRMTWWDHKGTLEWVQYDFAKPTKLASAEVYWFDDHGGCRLPKSWRLLYRDGDTWRPVENASDYSTKPDCYNQVKFKPVSTSTLRLEVQLRANASGGVLEWKVE